MSNYDVVIVGCGFAGATMAERFSNDGKRVLIIDKRDHIGGNMYDFIDENGILIHRYGPHLFHTNYEHVANYVRQFGDWFFYEHRVLGKVVNQLVPIPFNLTSIRQIFPEQKANRLILTLLEAFELEKKIPILELKSYPDNDINELAEFIYEHVFLYYTMKQWGQKPSEIDPDVINRVPVYLSTDDRYFQDQYQMMPKEGYTKLFEKMLQNPKIEIQLNKNAYEILQFEQDGTILLNGIPFLGQVIYTGAIDELFQYRYGNLPYRTLQFGFETVDQEYFQPVATVNYPTKEDLYTRITEYKHMTMEHCNSKKTTIMKEIPGPYLNNGDIPYYPINNEKSDMIYQKYLNDAQKYSNLHLLGRLAQYKYYNMDFIIKEALELYERLKGSN